MEAIEVLRRTKPIVTLVVARVNEHSSIGSDIPDSDLQLPDVETEELLHNEQLNHGLSEDDISIAVNNSDKYSK